MKLFSTLLAVSFLSAGVSLAAEPATKPAAQPDAKHEKMDPMMEAWMKAATPGSQHKDLASHAGTWQVVVKSWMDPKGEPMMSEGTTTMTSIFGGRYLQEQVEGSSMGQPFSGMGLTGYDNVTGKYVGVWLDNMGTGLMTSQGTAAEGGKVINWTGEFSDPMTGKTAKARIISRMVSASQMTFEMWVSGPDGKEFRNMELTYTRK